MKIVDINIGMYLFHEIIWDCYVQVWNHDFFWQSIKPNGPKKPEGELLKLIERDFGSFEAFADEFKQAAATQFGSGWAWLAGMYCHFCIIIYKFKFLLTGLDSVSVLQVQKCFTRI